MDGMSEEYRKGYKDALDRVIKMLEASLERERKFADQTHSATLKNVALDRHTAIGAELTRVRKLKQELI